MGFNKRDLLKHIGVSTAAVSSFSVVSATSGESDEPTEWLAVAIAGNSNNNLLAFTALKDQTLCLYLATGTSSADSPADDVTRLTDPSDGSVFDVHWVDPSTLSIWKNGETVHLSITSSGSVSDRSAVKDQAIPPGLITTQSGHSSQSVGGPVLDPGGGGGGGDDGGSGGGGDKPDWFDNPDFEMEPIKKCEDISNLGVELANICVETDSIKPKAYTKSCTGYEQPLFGFSHSSVSLSTPAGGGSVGLDIWAGFDPATGCIYMGSEMANICVSECFPPDSPPTQSDIEDSFKDDIMDIVEASEDEFQDVVDLPWAQYGGTVLIIVGIILVAIVAAIFSIFPGAPQPA